VSPPLPTTTLALPARRGRTQPARRRGGRVLAGRGPCARLLRRRPERQLRRHRDLLDQRVDLSLQIRDLGPQHQVVRRQALSLAPVTRELSGLGPPPPRLRAPELDPVRTTEIVHTTEIAAALDPNTRSPPTAQVQHPGTIGVSQDDEPHPVVRAVDMPFVEPAKPEPQPVARRDYQQGYVRLEERVE